MSRADELRARAERLKAKQSAADEGKRPAPTATGVQTHKSRSTVDLLPARHQSFKAWCGETAIEIGQTRVTTQQVLSTMVGLLLTDETLARKVRAELRKSSSQ